MGVHMSSTMINCRGCAQEIHESAPTCPKCGATQPREDKEVVSRLVLIAAYIMAVFMPFAGLGCAGYLFIRRKAAHAVGVLAVALLGLGLWKNVLPMITGDDLSAETVCKKVIYGHAPSSPNMAVFVSQKYEQCVRNMSALNQESPDSFKKWARCVMDAKNDAQAGTCG